jgi:hypothetical protein
MDKIDEIEGIFAVKQFQELCRIHKNSLLVHSRSQYTRDLARKLRPEFSKLLVTTDVRVCVKLIAKRNAEISGVGGIDIVVIEYDPSTLKLLEYINKRPMTGDTMKHPLIPTIVLLNEGTEPGTRESIESVGGSNAIFQLPIRTNIIMAEIIDILHRRRQLDSTFKDLKQNRVQYPFLAVFTVSKDEIEREAKEASSMQGSVVLYEEKDALFDDWMECESILPDDLNAIRNIEREKRDPADLRDLRFPNTMDRLLHEMAERQIVDRKLSHSAHVALAELRGNRAITAELAANFETMMVHEDASL